jgi:hypothetical protein
MKTLLCKNQENPSDRISHAWAPLSTCCLYEAGRHAFAVAVKVLVCGGGGGGVCYHFSSQKSLNFRGGPFQWVSKWICPHRGGAVRSKFTSYSCPPPSGTKCIYFVPLIPPLSMRANLFRGPLEILQNNLDTPRGYII